MPWFWNSCALMVRFTLNHNKPRIALGDQRNTIVHSSMVPQLRIARPVSHLFKSIAMYCQGLGLKVIGSFENHAGFDGAMLSTEGSRYHLEFTCCRTHPVFPTPTPEDLLVFYLPSEKDWSQGCADMLAAGFKPMRPFNPYWDIKGHTYQDHDGYRTVLQCSDWGGAA